MLRTSHGNAIGTSWPHHGTWYPPWRPNRDTMTHGTHNGSTMWTPWRHYGALDTPLRRQGDTMTKSTMDVPWGHQGDTVMHCGPPWRCRIRGPVCLHLSSVATCRAAIVCCATAAALMIDACIYRFKQLAAARKYFAL